MDHGGQDQTHCNFAGRRSGVALPAIVGPRLMRIQDAARYLSATIRQAEILLQEKVTPCFVIGKGRASTRAAERYGRNGFGSRKSGNHYSPNE
jgi:hypothetical protein